MHASFTGRNSLYVLDTKVYLQYLTTTPVHLQLFKVNNKNIRKTNEACSKLTVKALTTNISWDVALDVFAYTRFFYMQPFFQLSLSDA